MTALCQCGCAQSAPIATQTSRRDGWVKGEPLKYIRGHRSRLLVRYVEEGRGYETPCWIWQGATDRKGYGSVRQRGGPNLAHVLYYVEANGPVPEGFVLDHLCRQPSCVNPEHLEPVTNTENIRRGIGTKLTIAAVLAIRASDEPLRVLAERYGVSRGTIGNVRSRQSWQDVAA